MMKVSIVLIAICCALSGCGKDDNPKTYSFKDQDITGKIGNSSWSMLSGYAHSEISGEDTFVYITCNNTTSIDPCSSYPSDYHVFFTLPLKTGLYVLGYDAQNPFLGWSVTLFNIDAETNSIADVGAVEIISVSETQITGRIDASADELNFVNGNFTVTICDE
jgi:hypothetical protein